MRRLFTKFVLPVILVLAGIGILFLTISSAKAGKNFVEISATISSITSEYDNVDEDYDYTVMVDYTYEGQEYQAVLGEYRASFSEGDQVDIKVNPENPGEIQSASALGSILGIGLGAVAIIAGIAMFLNGLKG